MSHKCELKRCNIFWKNKSLKKTNSLLEFAWLSVLCLLVENCAGSPELCLVCLCLCLGIRKNLLFEGSQTVCLIDDT